MTQPLIKLNNVKKIFFTDEIESHALKNISLTVYAGEYLSISGPSGCGKSTLLSLLGLLDSPTEGQYRFIGNDVSNLSKGDRAKIRNKDIGFIFQSFNLISDLNVEENVELPLTYRTDLNNTQRKQMVRDALAQVDMVHRSRHFPAQLSGGQQQRAAIARAIAGKPSIILADEPTGNLDTRNADTVMQLLDTLHKGGTTICMVTHDPRSAQRSQRVIEILDGQIVADNAVSTELKSA